MQTYNVDGQVPDSAGTATAFLCGVKANVGVIGVNQKVRRGVCEDMTKDTTTSNGVQSIVRWSISEGL
jgi:alkaline phosphatase